MSTITTRKRVAKAPKLTPPPPSGPVTPSPRECLTCTHFLAESDGGGWCRALPPIAVASVTREEVRPDPADTSKHKRLIKHQVVVEYATRFPRMSMLGSCGLHKPRDRK